MAVTTLPRARARRGTLVAATLPPLVLFLAVVPLAVDFLAIVQRALALETLALALSLVAAVALGLSWARHPRTSWLAASVLAAIAGLAMRLVGADVAPLLSLLAVVAIGIGGAFASPTRELDNWLEVQPSVARR